MDKQTTYNDFLQKLSGSDPVPGGGGAAAAAAALASSLGHMVGSLTVGKKKYADVEGKMVSLMEQARELTSCMLELINRDAEAFTDLAELYKLPADTEGTKMLKQRAMEPALVKAAQVPLLIMEACGEIMVLLKGFGEFGSRLVISDAAAGAAICRGALQAASINVYVNTKLMKDRGKAIDLERCAEEILDTYLPMADDIVKSVQGRL